jgi:hypothetical protein
VALYFFHLSDGSDRLLDVEGQELPDLDAAKAFALLCARDTLSHEMRQGVLNLRIRLDVADAAGAVVHTLPLKEAFLILKPNESSERNGWKADATLMAALGRKLPL